MSSPVTLNIVIPQGTTFIKTFEFRHRLELAKDLIPSVSTPPIAISIKPLAVDIPAGTRLKFPLEGCDYIELESATVTPSGADIVMIQPYAGTESLPCRSAANVSPKNLTGQSWRGAAKADYRLATILNFDFELTPLDGRVMIKAAAIDTAVVLANCQYDELPSTADLQNKSRVDLALWKKAYYWDAEYQTPTGEVFRVFQGRLWVSAEATS